MAAWEALGVTKHSKLEKLFEEIASRYSEEHRHYHTVQHLNEGLQHLDEINYLANHPAEV